MTEVLYQYLKEQWKVNNLPKYQKYFEKWVSNLTDNQIYYYDMLWLKKERVI
jgi:hypothetical protein